MAASSWVMSHCRFRAGLVRTLHIVRHIDQLYLNISSASRPFSSSIATKTRKTYGYNEILINEGNDQRREADLTQIPDPGDASLHQYVKTLEEKLACKTTVQRGWARLTAKKGISSAFKPDSFPPQILGLTPRLLKERLEFLEGIGITGKDAMIIAADFPPVLSWDCPTFTDMLQLLVGNLGCNVVKLMSKTPYVFALNFQQAKANVATLVSVGLPNEVIGQLVDYNPVLLAYSFQSEALEIIGYLYSQHEELGDVQIGRSHTSALKLLPKLLIQPFERPGEQVEVNENFKKVVSFLKELQVPPWVIAVSNPGFFNADAEKLYDTLEFFMNRPLFLETELLQKLLIQRSEIFVNFDISALKKRIQLAYNVLQNPTRMYMLLQSHFFFEGGETKLEENVKMFRDYGFEDKHIAQLISFKDFYSPEGSDLKEKLEFLLSVEGVTVERISECMLCLLKPLAFLQMKLQFLTAVNPKMLKEVEFKKILMSEHKEFVTQICKSDLDEYKRVMETLLRK